MCQAGSLSHGRGQKECPSEVEWAGKYRHQQERGKEEGGLLALQAAHTSGILTLDEGYLLTACPLL